MLMNLSSVINATSAAEIVAAHRAELPAEVAGAWQEPLLAFLDSETIFAAGTSTLTEVKAANSASLMIAIVEASNGTLTASSQATALDVLRRIAMAPIDVMSNTSATLSLALSAVAPSVIASSNVTALQTWLAALESLAVSQATNLLARQAAAAPAVPLLPAVTTSTLLLQLFVQVDPPGSTRLTTLPITAPGSPSSFEPLPASVLASVMGTIITIFFSLPFNPYIAANRTLITTGGITHLELSNADLSPVVVANLTTPIRFTLPPANSSASTELAVCSFWDAAAREFSTVGCTSPPKLRPPGHVVSFLPNFTASSDADLVLGWDISGPMVNGGTCFIAVLNCSADDPGPYFVDAALRQLVPSHSPGVVYPDPLNPLAVPAVACPSSTAGNSSTAGGSPTRTALRVYYGSACALWQADNAYNCSWDNLLQSFVGAGCVSDGGPTQCMCRHVRSAAARAAHTIFTEAT